MIEEQRFLFLQGPPGPLFGELAAELRARGAKVERINLSAGDWLDWPGEATDFRGRFTDWPVFVDNFLRDHGITDILLFGDCRPYHASAQQVASLRSIRTHVLEEGYLRPNWMTLELEGVNGHSRLGRDPAWFRNQAARVPREPDLPQITASFRRRVRDTARYYTATYVGMPAFPHYRSHRPHFAIGEALGWGWRYLTGGRRAREAEGVIDALSGKGFFLLPLQLSGDYQIRSHSPFPNMPAAAAYVLESFAANAPAHVHLLVKGHPLDASFFHWRRFLARRAEKLGVSGRVHYIDGGDLEDLASRCLGMVCVNSTSATLALAEERPVCVLGDAVYKVPGLTFEGHLDSFWRSPRPPEPGLYDAFRKVLVDRCLVRGGIASESAVSTLVGNMAERLSGAAAQSESSHRSTVLKWPSQVGAR